MKQRQILGLTLIAVSLMLSLASQGWSDDGKWTKASKYGNKYDSEYGSKYGSKSGKTGSRTADVAPVTNKTYQAECSACHFAYQPGLLPERSWKRIMGSLEDHFGENAELDKATHSLIENYLRGHAADHIPNRISRSLLRSIAEPNTPLRFTDTRYFQSEHHEIPQRLVKGNPKVRSFSNCLSCHTTAEQGVFDEDRVVIAGYGRWED